MTTARSDDATRWNERAVAWYQRANAESDYADQVLGAAADVIAGCRTALDVGAGFGALALPLAQRLAVVTALEPSPTMARALRQAARARDLANIHVIEARWGEHAVAPHDLVLCAHVGPLLRRGSAFLADVGGVARRAVLLVHDALGGDDKFFFSELYPRLLGRPYGEGDRSEELLAALADLGIIPAVRDLTVHSDQPFDSLDEACDFWMTWMGLTESRQRAYLAGFLGERLVRTDRGWRAPYAKRIRVLTWRAH